MARSQPTRRGDERTGGSRESGEDEKTGGRREWRKTRQLAGVGESEKTGRAKSEGERSCWGKGSEGELQERGTGRRRRYSCLGNREPRRTIYPLSRLQALMAETVWH